MDLFNRITWRPEIGDPNATGWITVAAYLAAVLLCLTVSLRLRLRRDSSSTLWLVVALIMGFLCVNKQIDLQTLMINIGQVIARDEGWYAYRRPVQAAFVGAVALCGVVSLWWAVRTLRESLAKDRLLLAGCIILVSFVIIRAASFHHVEELLDIGIFNTRVNALIELSGIGCIILAALMRMLFVHKGNMP